MNSRKKENKGTKAAKNIQGDTASYFLKQVAQKQISLTYSGPKTSTNGGLLLLREVAEELSLFEQINACKQDQRDQRYVKHAQLSLFKQRVYQIAAGYEDGNDSTPLRSDKILQLCVGNLPKQGAELASQPTMSRFENSANQGDLYRIAECIGKQFIDSYAEEPAVIILDSDDTNHTAHGEQEGIEYNHYYGEYCFQPLHIYEGVSGKLVTAVLKPGRRSKAVEVFSIQKRVITFIRQYWSETLIIIRGDSHFCSADLMDWAAGEYKVSFITGLAGNSRLTKLSQTTIQSAKRSYDQQGRAVRSYHSFTYQAASWKTPQRVIVKVQINKKGEKNIRYIVTDLREYRTKNLYEIGYCARGSMELRIKDHKTYLKSDRSSCTSFLANQFRLFLHSIAYILLHTLQKQVLKGTPFENATMKTLQLKLIKVTAVVKEYKTFIRIELPQCCEVAQIQGKVFQVFERLRLSG